MSGRITHLPKPLHPCDLPNPVGLPKSYVVEQDAGLAKRQEARLARYCQDVACPGKSKCTDPDCALARDHFTAAEVEEACKVAALKRQRNEARAEGHRGWPLLTEAAVIAREIGSQAVSEPRTGLPAHPSDPQDSETAREAL